MSATLGTSERSRGDWGDFDVPLLSDVRVDSSHVSAKKLFELFKRTVKADHLIDPKTYTNDQQLMAEIAGVTLSYGAYHTSLTAIPHEYGHAYAWQAVGGGKFEVKFAAIENLKKSFWEFLKGTLLPGNKMGVTTMYMQGPQPAAASAFISSAGVGGELLGNASLFLMADKLKEYSPLAGHSLQATALCSHILSSLYPWSYFWVKTSGHDFHRLATAVATLTKMSPQVIAGLFAASYTLVPPVVAGLYLLNKAHKKEAEITAEMALNYLLNTKDPLEDDELNAEFARFMERKLHYEDLVAVDELELQIRHKILPSYRLGNEEQEAYLRGEGGVLSSPQLKQAEKLQQELQRAASECQRKVLGRLLEDPELKRFVDHAQRLMQKRMMNPPVVTTPEQISVLSGVTGLFASALKGIGQTVPAIVPLAKVMSGAYGLSQAVITILDINETVRFCKNVHLTKKVKTLMVAKLTCQIAVNTFSFVALVHPGLGLWAVPALLLGACATHVFNQQIFRELKRINHVKRFSRESQDWNLNMDRYKEFRSLEGRPRLSSFGVRQVRLLQDGPRLKRWFRIQKEAVKLGFATEAQKHEIIPLTSSI